MAGEDDFLRRWSRRKTQARDPAREPPSAPKPVAPTAAGSGPDPAPAAEQPAPLPPVESLTPQSDFSPFMAADVDPDLRRQALKTLFGDPHFNTMDMLDIYVDDYSKPDPLPEGWLEKLNQVSRLGDAAGRDREEAEKRRLERLAEEGGTPADAEAAQQRVLSETAGETDTVPVPDGGMPPLPEGKSGT